MAALGPQVEALNGSLHMMEVQLSERIEELQAYQRAKREAEQEVDKLRASVRDVHVTAEHALEEAGQREEALQEKIKALETGPAKGDICTQTDDDPVVKELAQALISLEAGREVEAESERRAVQLEETLLSNVALEERVKAALGKAKKASERLSKVNRLSKNPNLDPKSKI